VIPVSHTARYDTGDRALHKVLFPGSARDPGIFPHLEMVRRCFSATGGLESQTSAAVGDGGALGFHAEPVALAQGRFLDVTEADAPKPLKRVSSVCPSVRMSG